MKLKSIAALLAAGVTLSSCYTVPEEPDFVLNVDGNYKAVADCAWVKFRTMGNWRRTDLDSMGTVELAFGNDVSTAGRIDITADGPNKTKVVSHMMRAVWGKDFWPSKHRPIFQACSR